MQTHLLRHLRVLVGVSEIAVLTGNKSAVVTNWRSRFESFPRPVVAGARPQFELTKVMEWLDSGEGPRTATVPDIAPEKWWEFAVRAFLLEAPVELPRQTLAALLVLHHRRGRDLLRQVVGIDSSNGRDVARALADAVVEAEANDPDLQHLFVPLLGSLTPDAALAVVDMVRVLFLDGWTEGPLDQLEKVLADVDVSAGPARTTASSLASVMAALAAIPDGAVVFDPACGEGAALVACARSAADVRLFGQELDADTLLIARSRLLLAGLETSGLAPAGFDSLREDQFPDLRADVVILDPPVNAARAPLARWLPHALRHCKPEGRVVVSLPLSSVVKVAAARRDAEKPVKSELERLAAARRISAAVVLPRGHRSDVVGPMLVLVLAGEASGLGADEQAVVAFVETRDERGFQRGLIPELATTVRAGGFVGLASMETTLVTAELVAGFKALTDALERKCSEAEAGVTRGRRSKKKPSAPVNDNDVDIDGGDVDADGGDTDTDTDTDTYADVHADTYADVHADVDVERGFETLFSRNILDDEKPSFFANRMFSHIDTPRDFGGDLVRLQSLRLAARQLVDHIEELRPRLGEDLYEQLQAELHELKRLL